MQTDIANVCVLKVGHVRQPRIAHLLKAYMKWQDLLHPGGRPGQPIEASKKNRWRSLKRHRLKDGIPKEEEEKPRKQILQ